VFQKAGALKLIQESKGGKKESNQNHMAFSENQLNFCFQLDISNSKTPNLFKKWDIDTLTWQSARSKPWLACE
jgi:hypothetical protein